MVTPAVAPASKGSSRNVWIGLGIVAVIVVIAVMSAGGSSKTGYANPNLVSHSGTYIGSTVTETGTIRNDGTDTASSVRISIIVKDVAGNILGQGRQDLGSLAAGQSVDFVVSATLVRAPQTVDTELIWEWYSEGGCPPGTYATADPENPSSTSKLCQGLSS